MKTGEGSFAVDQFIEFGCVMKKFGFFALLAWAVVTTSAAWAAPERYAFDTEHTQIFFSVNHLGYSHSTGKFPDFDGHFILDPKQPENSNVEVTINTNNIEIGSQAWVDHLRNADFFNVEKFPTMTFKSTKVDVTGEKTAKVTGDLTLLGVTKPVTLDVTMNKRDVHPYSGKMAAGFSVRGKLKRSDFGMNYGVPAVGDEVEIRIEVEGTVDHSELNAASEGAS